MREGLPETAGRYAAPILRRNDGQVLKAPGRRNPLRPGARRPAWLWALDFETESIDRQRPHIAPKPVGLAYRMPGSRKTVYLDWGHPGSDPENEGRARIVLEKAWADHRRPLLFHKAQFDLAVAKQHFGLPWPDDRRIECTLILAFLANPYRDRLGLKELAEDLLGVPPDEQKELYDWIRANVPEAKRKKELGNWIARAPASLVAPYARGDVDRTLDLWKLFAPIRRVFSDAYHGIEIPVIQVAQWMTETGVPLDVDVMERFTREAPKEILLLEARIRRYLSLPRGAELSGDVGLDAVADALERFGLVDPKDWILTAKGGFRSLAWEDLLVSMRAGFESPMSGPRKLAKLFHRAWRRRGLVQWQLSNIVKPWLTRQENGIAHVSWNTTRNAESGKLIGARTGRLSSSPNAQNWGKRHDETPREWVRAPRGERLVGGDLKSQEPRITAHFAGGRMREGYVANPLFDPHQQFADEVAIDRDPAKTVGLGSIYALGVNMLARRLGRPRSEASRLRRQFWAARPEVAELDQLLKHAWQTGGTIRTWAGVEVRAEPTDPPSRFAYRALNCLIQRSAAEQLKVAMIDAHQAGLKLCLSVHDELMARCHHSRAKQDAAKLKAAMEGTHRFRPWTVPFVADVKVGRTWRSLK